MTDEDLLAQNEHLQAENAALKQRVVELEAALKEALAQLEAARRAGKRQAAPFSKGVPKTDPKTPGRKPGDAYGLKAHREPPSKIDQVIPVDLPEACPCGGDLDFVETVQQFQTEIPRQAIHRYPELRIPPIETLGQRAVAG